MSIVFRTIPTTRAVNPFIASSCRLQRSNLQTWRAYSHSSYGGEGEADAEPSKATRDLEHPGSSPESSGQTSQGKEYAIPKETSNKAHPTITDGRQSPNVDDAGNTRDNVPEDVKRHNKEMEERYDRPYNQIADEGKVHKGFWRRP
ncbi:predicted protein [Aspergillus terreus NIH2624]|uniref:Uncharacterized protein n=1 Tax=Aspergillus terreus (strain NIH 2624 / FGSC A1156) TaxID=341663 RepID=Q0CP10_ASPTN|nr:uncharacterized protein ATEG_04574 [Aspergillus terreus NIH2624]EAU35021.1 predicted protein [Aspergillus terreus NIH2624]